MVDGGQSILLDAESTLLFPLHSFSLRFFLLKEICLIQPSRQLTRSNESGEITHMKNLRGGGVFGVFGKDALFIRGH